MSSYDWEANLCPEDRARIRKPISLEDRIAELREIEANTSVDMSSQIKSLTVSHSRNETVRLPVVTSCSGLLSATFPPRDRLLSPWLLSQSLSMIYAARGCGKTHVALGVAYALATGGEFLGWRASQAVPVLYLDGEMPGADLQGRVQRIVASHGTAAPDCLRFMTPDQQPDGMMPNLFTPQGQKTITDQVGDSRVIIVDNLSCLVRGGKENEIESWKPVQEWALRMRAEGRSVVFIHHAGKGGQQRGTGGREDVLDTVIALRRPLDYEPEQGARFEIHFEKARALYGEDVAPMEAALQTAPNGIQSWTTRAVAEASEEQILEYLELGMGNADIMSEIGCSKATFFRKKKELIASGKFKPRGKKPVKPSPAMIMMTGGADDYRRASNGD